MVPMERRYTEGVPSLESVTRYLVDIGSWRVPKSGNVTIIKIENLRIDTGRKFTDSKNAILFDLRRKLKKLSRKNRFRTVERHHAGACESSSFCV